MRREGKWDQGLPEILPVPRESVPTVTLLKKPVRDVCAVQQSNSQRTPALLSSPGAQIQVSELKYLCFSFPQAEAGD